MIYNHVQQPGALISIDMGAYDHVGLVTNRFIEGMPTIISLSETHNTVVEQSWYEAVENRKVKLYSEQGVIDPSHAITRARAYLGKLRWSFFYNCEHFARAVHGLEVKSIELRKIAFKGLIVAGTIWALIKLSKKR